MSYIKIWRCEAIQAYVHALAKGKKKNSPAPSKLFGVIFYAICFLLLKISPLGDISRHFFSEICTPGLQGVQEKMPFWKL